MKILFVNDFSGRVGGTEAYLSSLAHNLRRRGHSVLEFYGSDDYEKSLAIRSNLRSYLHRIFSVQQFFHFQRVVKEFQPDIIHMHNIFNEVTPSILLMLPPIPVIMTIHDYQIIQAVATPEERNGKQCKKMFCPGCLNCVGLKGAIYEVIKRTIHSLLLQRTNMFIAPSLFMQKTIRENSSYKPKHLYNGFTLYTPLPLANTSTALYSGRLTRGKGVEHFVDAILLVRKKIKEFNVVIAGDGELRQELEKKVDNLGLGKVVTFVGHLSKAQIFSQYKQCSIVVVPSSFSDNLPTVCIEALSLGRPVVASNVGGIPEIVKDGVNGYLSKPGDPISLSRGILRLLSNKATLKRVSQTASTTLHDFDIDTHIEKILEIYNAAQKHH
jgi:glycosyltransferase involved in cell wall biosynthesis